ncbi:peptidyl-prolyl cis-trans isomerase D [Bombyx mori]|uniref:peptidylprolyl isomerase n=1 Tax=Bombyx mori TaxID=7091 RepID=A0A8R2M0V7_BOMMO|nr:peptidyl-prolyl cis-trans isomerase D isoform X2 [Bombyx mori]
MSSDRRSQTNPFVYLDISIDGVSAGRIVIELRSDVVPKTAENFRALCTGEKGIGVYGKPLHYKGVRFHKAVNQFMVQGGDIVNGDGSGGESIYGPKFEDENFTLTAKSGVLAMANEGRPDTNSSQFCITTIPCPHINGTNVIFGEVVAGFELVDEMQRYGEGDDGRPGAECVIEDCGEITEQNWDVCCRDGTSDKIPEFPTDWRNIGAVSLDDLISCIRDVKAAGNGMFSERRYKAAIRKYRKCLRYVDYALSIVQGMHEKETEHIIDLTSTFILQCNLNLAACYSRTEDYRACIECCTQVLDRSPRNEKALYRRGQANFALKNYEAALSDLRRAERASPHNRAVLALLDEVRRCSRRYNELQKQRLSKFFREQKERAAAANN